MLRAREWLLANSVGLLSLVVTILLAFYPPKPSENPSTQNPTSYLAQQPQPGPIAPLSPQEQFPSKALQVMVLDPLSAEWRPLYLLQPQGTLLNPGDVVLLNTGERGIIVALGLSNVPPSSDTYISAIM